MGTGTKRYPRNRATSFTREIVAFERPAFIIEMQRSEIPVADAITVSETPGRDSWNCRNSIGDTFDPPNGQTFANGTRHTFRKARGNIFGMASADQSSDLMLVLAANVRAARERAGLTRAQLAARAGFSERTIGYLEAPAQRQRGIRGDASATISSLIRIADALGVKAWQLLVPEFDPLNEPIIVPRQQATEESELVRLFRAMDPDNRPALVARARRLREISDDEPDQRLPTATAAGILPPTP